MHPASALASVSATQAHTCSCGSKPKYVPSWCHAAKVGECGSLMKNVLVHTRMSGPIRSSIASRMRGMADQRVEPRRMRIGVRAPLDVRLGDRRSPVRFPADPGRRGRSRFPSGVSAGIGKQEAVVAIRLHLRLRQCLHGVSSVARHARQCRRWHHGTARAHALASRFALSARSRAACGAAWRRAVRSDGTARPGCAGRRRSPPHPRPARASRRCDAPGRGRLAPVAEREPG